MATYGIFAQGDLLSRVAVERMLAGVATRGFERVGDPIGAKARSAAQATSKSAVSRRFVAGTKRALGELLGRDLSGGSYRSAATQRPAHGPVSVAVGDAIATATIGQAARAD